MLVVVLLIWGRFVLGIVLAFSALNVERGLLCIR